MHAQAQELGAALPLRELEHLTQEPVELALLDAVEEGVGGMGSQLNGLPQDPQRGGWVGG